MSNRFATTMPGEPDDRDLAAEYAKNLEMMFEEVRNLKTMIEQTKSELREACIALGKKPQDEDARADCNEAARLIPELRGQLAEVLEAVRTTEVSP